MAKILAIANQKGGVGKTTTAVNLSASLAATKRRVLLIDMDPQGNATMGTGVDKHEVEYSLYHALTGNATLDQVICDGGQGQFKVLPGNSDSTAAEVALMETNGGEKRLTQLLASVESDFDYILIDCAPSLSMLSLNALVAAEGVIIPMQCEYYALEGLSALLQTIDSIQQNVNPKLQIEGLVRTMYDPRSGLTKEVSEQLQQHFGDRLYSTAIPRNIRLAEAPSHGMPALQYDKSSTGAMAYLALAGEMNRRYQAGAPA